MKLKKLFCILSAFAMLCSVSSGAAAYDRQEAVPYSRGELYASENNTDIVRMSDEKPFLPMSYDNTENRRIPISFLRPCSEGYMRVVADQDSQSIYIEYYSDSFSLISKKNIPFELDIWGGFYESADAFFVVQGTLNLEDSDNAEAIRIIKYDKIWNRLGAVSIISDSVHHADIRVPFDMGCVEFTEHNGKLYIATGHQGYYEPGAGKGHQGLLLIEVDETALTSKIIESSYHHSFYQYAEADNDDIYVLEQFESIRYAVLNKYDTLTDKHEYIKVFGYGGKNTGIFSLDCYATINDMAISSENIIGVHMSIDQSQYDNFSYSDPLPYNLYLTVSSKSDFSEEGTVVKQITDYTNGTVYINNPKITKINDNRFLLTWGYSEESQAGQTDDNLSHSLLHYIFIDGSGNSLSEEFTAEANASDCHPVLNGDEIVFMTSIQSQVNFYSINANTGSFSKTIHRVAGKYASWEYDANTQSLYIMGKGELFDGPDRLLRLSKDGFGELRYHVKKVFIGKGITSIGDYTFYYFKKLMAATMFDGMTSIGAHAFEESSQLQIIYFPASVREIGEGALHYDYYRAKVFSPYGSYAWNHFNQKNFKTYEMDLSKTEEFVERLYTTLLLREYDQKGHADWVFELAGGKSAAEVAEGFVLSPEITNQDPSSTEFVTRMYHTFMNREPDGAGLADWVNALESGCSYAYILYSFVHSEEFGNICSDYGINRGTYTPSQPRDINRTLTAFVARMYTKALGRSFDVDGLNTWTGAYLRGEQDARGIAYGFIFSREFLNRNLSDEEYIEVLYQTFFDRPSDEVGKANWLNALANGDSREAVLNGFLGSQEFIELTAKFGV